MQDKTYYRHPSYKHEFTSDDLVKADCETQLDVMRQCFFENYEDPVNNTPYESAEGGYIYIYGGPYEALEGLQNEFRDIVPDAVIEQLADELNEITHGWTGHGVDEEFYREIAERTDQRATFDSSLGNIESLLSLPKNDSPVSQHLLRLLYVSVITTLETYLSDLFIAGVANDPDLRRKFVETTPKFAKEKVTLVEYYKTDIERIVKTHLLEVRWHRVPEVREMYRDTLSIGFIDELAQLIEAITIRHDLVHRNGRKKDGSEHHLCADDIRELIRYVSGFVVHIDEQWSNKTKHLRPPDGPLEDEDSGSEF